MPKQFISGKYHEMRHNILPAEALVFNVVPFLAKARLRAEQWGEAVAVYRYMDEYADDVFFTAYEDLAFDIRRGGVPEYLVIEAVVNPKEV